MEWTADENESAPLKIICIGRYPVPVPVPGTRSRREPENRVIIFLVLVNRAYHSSLASTSPAPASASPHHFFDTCLLGEFAIAKAGFCSLPSAVAAHAGASAQWDSRQVSVCTHIVLKLHISYNPTLAWLLYLPLLPPRNLFASASPCFLHHMLHLDPVVRCMFPSACNLVPVLVLLSLLIQFVYTPQSMSF